MSFRILLSILFIIIITRVVIQYSVHMQTHMEYGGSPIFEGHRKKSEIKSMSH